MSTIAAVVLTKNEEANVARCLRSLAWADELLVVDSGSTDRTLELARRHAATTLVHVQGGPFDIAEQRNWVLNHARFSSDWVLFVDADEEIPPSLARRIRETCESATDHNAFELAPKYLFFGQWMRRSMRYPSWHPRLVRRGHASYTGGVWEHFDDRAMIGRIDEPYIHHGNSKGFADWLERHERYSTWDAETIGAYLSSGDPDAFQTRRRLRVRRLAARVWPIRPIVRFLHMYVIRGGFLDGRYAFLFCLRYFVYEYMTVEKLIEQRRLARRAPL